MINEKLRLFTCPVAVIVPESLEVLKMNRHSTLADMLAPRTETGYVDTFTDYRLPVSVR